MERLEHMNPSIQTRNLAGRGLRTASTLCFVVLISTLLTAQNGGPGVASQQPPPKGADVQKLLDAIDAQQKSIGEQQKAIADQQRQIAEQGEEIESLKRELRSQRSMAPANVEAPAPME